MSVTGAGWAGRPSKYGGLRTYVESSSHAKRSPVGTSRERQRSSPAYTPSYDFTNMSD